MSYPEPRYAGETGEVSARIRRADHPPELTYPSGVTVHYLATGASTDGEFGLYRWDFAPTVSGPDPHFHKTISESFYILFGVVNLYDGERWVEAKAGDFLFVPEGGIHAFKNKSGERASMLLLFAPGAPREDYFETLAEVGRGRELTDDERTEFYFGTTPTGYEPRSLNRRSRRVVIREVSRRPDQGEDGCRRRRHQPVAVAGHRRSDPPIRVISNAVVNPSHSPRSKSPPSMPMKNPAP